MKVCIAGASGYTGIELLRILELYKEIEINQITSRQYSGKALKEAFPFFNKSKYQDLIFTEEVDAASSDIYFLCLPHEPSLELVKILYENNKIIIDLSAAYRIKNKEAYPEYYGFEHRFPELLEVAVYGLTEIFRDDIKYAKIIANPGCYPTATILGLYPLAKEGKIQDDTIIVNALSGISGAGRHLKEDFMYPESFSNAYAYNITKHRHTPEMEDVIKRISDKDIKVRFTPHIIPVSRGMLSTITVKTDLSRKQLRDLYFDYYEKEYFIRLQDRPVRIKEVLGTNFCDIFVDKDEKTGYTVITSAIDNLGKGASSQAVQNMNIVLGFEESYNLKNLPIYPWLQKKEQSI